MTGVATVLMHLGFVLDRDFEVVSGIEGLDRIRWFSPQPQPTQAEIDAAAPAALAALAAEQAEATAYQADRTDLQTQYANAVTRLEQIRDAPSLSNTQAVTAIKDLAAVQLRMLKYIRRL